MFRTREPLRVSEGSTRTLQATLCRPVGNAGWHGLKPPYRFADILTWVTDGWHEDIRCKLLHSLSTPRHCVPS